MDSIKEKILYKRNPLPKNPSRSQKVRYAFLCPPHGFLASLLANILVILFLWLTAFFLARKDALPGGNIFALFVLYGASSLGGFVVSLLRLPPLLGMLIVGFMLRNVPGIIVATDIDRKWSSVLRSIALTVILTRAGLGLDGKALRKLSKNVLLLSFLPCAAEAITVGIAAYMILGFPWLWGFLLGCIQGAVSPAVLVPFMIQLQEEGLGTNKGIPTLLMAAGSLDDVLAISGFSIFLSLIFSTGAAIWYQIIQGPLELAMGLTYGICVGLLLWYIADRNHIDLSIYRFLLLLSAGLIAVFGSKATGFGGAGALGCLTTAFVAGYRWRQPGWNKELVKPSTAFNHLWNYLFQPLLFGLIGAEVALDRIQAETVGLAIAVLVLGLIVRMIFTVIAVSGAGLTWREKLFSAIAWIPKATVQAALGSLALDSARELNAGPEYINLGEKVVTIAVLLIIITAPLGALGISLTSHSLLVKETAIGEDVHADEKYALADIKQSPPEERTKMIGAH
ncbi:sodium/hydrogen exchanger 9B2-like isoform X2 [Paramacrobiotus metropolitanus]|nr:sodium/hydrogen exchanger 9B2-like isoform X2 [Paramacrobiotus metropolitanus]